MTRVSKFFKRIKNLLFYAGLDEEKFAYASEDFDKENIKMLTVIATCLTPIMGILVFLSFVVDAISQNRIIYFLGMIIGIIILFGCKVVCKKNPHAITYYTQILCVMLYGFGTMLGVYTQPNEIAVTFVILLVVLPVVFYDRPINALSLELLAIIIYLSLAKQFKNDYCFSSDLIDVVGYGILGAALNMFLTNIKATTAMAKVEAEKANSSKTTFLFNMSHDIRTPMNAIIGFTNIAKKNIKDEEKVLESLDKVTTSSDYLLSLINDVLDMSRAESGTIEVKTKEINIYNCLENTISIVKDSASAKDISLEVEFGEIENNYVFMDTFHINRVLMNVISNAIKYTNEGGKVKIKVFQDKAVDDEGIAIYKFQVIDNGIGISEEFQGMIFDAFSRERTTTVSGLQGTGLGMAITKKLVEIMNGSISVQSKVGEGSTFTISMPFVVQLHHTEKTEEEIVKENVVKLDGKRILVVDDNDLNREIAIDLLEDVGVITEEADDGQKAVDMLVEKGPDYYDLILMDVQMPIKNGYEATKDIRDMYPENRIPIVAMTANAFLEDKENAKKAGMDAHLAKPVDVDKLKDVLKTLM